MRKFFYNNGNSYSIELVKGLSPFGFYYESGGYDDDNTIFIGFLFLRIWISWGTIFKENKYGFTFNRNNFSIWYGKNDYFGEGEGNKIFSFWWNNIPNFIFGKQKIFWSEEKSFGKFNLKMEQGDEYIVKITGKQSYKWRPRWFGRKGWYSYTVIPDRIIPYQGKGENSWDCGDDGTSEMSTGRAKTPEEALEQLKQSCEKSRNKYGIVNDIQMKPNL